MKIKDIKILKYMMIASTGVLMLSSCNNWFDVRPDSEIYAKEHFKDQQGFSDQLVGVYTGMISQALYGQEMTFGLMDVLAQNYDLAVSSPYIEAASYNYENISIKSTIDNIWNKAYNSISNINLMLKYIDDDVNFDEYVHDEYKGAALGLRAFLHFDLLRMYAPMPKDAPSALSIPYVTDYTTTVTPQSTVAENILHIKADLYQAIDYLKADALYRAADETEAYVTKKLGAQTRFNYYAAVATLARVYQWEGNADSARICAEEIINAEKFSFVHYTAMLTSNPSERDFTYSTEHIFRLYFYDMSDVIDVYMRGSSNESYLLCPSEDKMMDIFEVNSAALGADYRYYYNFAYDGASTKTLIKFKQYENGSYLKMMPLIRLAEMYYIAAEGYSESNPNQAAKLLNKVRDNRGLSAYALDTLSMTTSAVQKEIAKEYRKETMAEGQLFFYYKRNGYTTIPGSSVVANDKVYLFTMPDNEIEFGDRK